MSVFHDDKHRPVFNTYLGGTAVFVWKEDLLEYVYVKTYFDEGSARKHFPAMVPHVNRRSAPPKKRHPAVHYRPTGKNFVCCELPGSTLTADQELNAKTTSNVTRVTCRVCLNTIVFMAKTQLEKGEG